MFNFRTVPSLQVATVLNRQLATPWHAYIYLLTHAIALFGTFIHAVTQFHYRTVSMSAESVGGSTPGVRVTWNTTLPPECVAAVRVEFRTSSWGGPVVATYTTTNTSQTEVIQTGLECATNYYIRVIVTGEPRPPSGTQMLSPRHEDVQVLVGGKEKFACDFNHGSLMAVMPLHRYTNPMRAEATADNTSIRVSWQWSCQGLLDFFRVHYQPEGGGGHVRVCSHVQTVLEQTTNLREAL